MGAGLAPTRCTCALSQRHRYTGGMVPDVFQIIVKEKGVFTNVTSPSTKAKLRILFEVGQGGCGSAPFQDMVEAHPSTCLHPLLTCASPFRNPTGCSPGPAGGERRWRLFR